MPALVAPQDQRGRVGGCPIGSLASELADHDEAARRHLVGSFDRWEGYLARGLARMRERGELATQADPTTLAMAVMASIQGGLPLTQTRKTSHALRVALDAALLYLRSFAAEQRPSAYVMPKWNLHAVSRDVGGFHPGLGVGGTDAAPHRLRRERDAP